MALRNTTERWGKVSKLLHWSIALLILVQVPLGFVMGHFHGKTFTDPSVLPLTHTLSMFHNTIGFLVLILAAIRLGWRVSQPSPEIPASLATYQRWLAHATHAFLYALLFIAPLSGWATLSAYGEWPIYLFVWDDIVPPIVDKLPLSDPNGFDLYSTIHKLCYQVGGALLALHIAAAVWHQKVMKDGLLSRMWF